MANQIIESIYDLVDEKKVPNDKLEALSRDIGDQLQGLMIDIQTVGEMISNSAKGTVSDTEEMSGFVVTNLGSYGQELCMVKGYIDTHLKETGGKQS